MAATLTQDRVFTSLSLTTPTLYGVPKHFTTVCTTPDKATVVFVNESVRQCVIVVV